MSTVGFEPTRTNTFELESNPLDQLGQIDLTEGFPMYIYAYITDILKMK